MYVLRTYICNHDMIASTGILRFENTKTTKSLIFSQVCLNHHHHRSRKSRDFFYRDKISVFELACFLFFLFLYYSFNTATDHEPIICKPQKKQKNRIEESFLILVATTERKKSSPEKPGPSRRCGPQFSDATYLGPLMRIQRSKTIGVDARTHTPTLESFACAFCIM